MKISAFTLLTAVASLLLLSCNKEETVINSGTYNCTFVQNDEDMDGLIDPTERSMMNDCREDRLLTKSEVEQNLIGEWALIGHGEGWVSTISQPCAYVKISSDELTFDYQDAYTDTLTTHTWEVEEVNWSGGTYYRLVVTPYVHGLFITEFCSSYMFGDGTPLDGNMYLYQKVE